MIAARTAVVIPPIKTSTVSPSTLATRALTLPHQTVPIDPGSAPIAQIRGPCERQEREWASLYYPFQFALHQAPSGKAGYRRQTSSPRHTVNASLLLTVLTSLSVSRTFRVRRGNISIVDVARHSQHTGSQFSGRGAYPCVSHVLTPRDLSHIAPLRSARVTQHPPLASRTRGLAVSRVEATAGRHRVNP